VISVAYLNGTVGLCSTSSKVIIRKILKWTVSAVENFYNYYRKVV